MFAPNNNMMKNLLVELMTQNQDLANYAETKLAAVIAFCSAIIIGVLSIISNCDGILRYYLIGVIVFNGIALFVAFSGIFAKTILNHKLTEIKIPKNYFFYKYVAQLHPIELFENIKTDYDLEVKNDQMALDICSQIIVLAKVAVRKFKYFNLALKFVVSGLFTPLGLFIFYFHNK